MTEPGQEPTNMWDGFRHIQSVDPRVRVEHRTEVAAMLDRKLEQLVAHAIQ